MYRNKVILTRFRHRRLNLANPGPGPAQWKLPTSSPDPKVVTKERKLPPLADAMHRYQTWPEESIKKYQRFPTFYDPLFNPHLPDGRYHVDPNEEPFNAIYADQTESEGAQEYTKVRDITNPEIWSFVERLARHRLAPEVRKRKAGEPITSLPSGFIPPPENPPDLPYFVPRTRNYLLPVYYELHQEPESCCTLVKQISGDIWQLADDLRNYLESLNNPGRRILTSVRETDETVALRGKHLGQVADWLHKQGF